MGLLLPTPLGHDMRVRVGRKKNPGASPGFLLRCLEA